MSLAILVGTRKGLFVIRGDEGRRKWTVEEPVLPGWDVFHAIAHDGTAYVAANNFVYGATVQRSTDFGKTWERGEGLGLPEESGLTLEKAWHVEPGSDDTLWLGAAPGVLFRSEDKGESWETVQSLLDEPTRERWQPGAGGMCTHSIQIDPENEQTMYVGISAAGVFRSEDGGDSWTPANKGTAADFMPDDPFPEVGQCVHKLLVHPAKPERLWQQNHCGVYRSDDRGENWDRLEGNGLPNGFGFPLALHPRDPDVALVVPEDGAENRVTSDGRLGVYKTTDGGKSWQLSSKGLPEPAWGAVMREGMSYDRLDPSGVYLGTQSGSVFVSPNEGEEWIEAASQLPPILSVEVAEWH
ncbi:MAG: exo-alpha-sialidase [Actinobacteria bacterium]|nr:MAG: exo-alpha-sialidase [Actinomycetota bacterium]